MLHDTNLSPNIGSDSILLAGSGSFGPLKPTRTHLFVGSQCEITSTMYIRTLLNSGFESVEVAYYVHQDVVIAMLRVNFAAQPPAGRCGCGRGGGGGT